jgi:hypothetical protein
MNAPIPGFAAAERQYDRMTPEDNRTHAQIEQDAADRLREERMKAAQAPYQYDPLVWANVTAQREAMEKNRREKAQADEPLKVA